MAIDDYRAHIETKLHASIEQMGEKNQLRDACEYALMNGGKRLRPILVLMIADSLGHGFDVTAVALSVEFFHTASLIADDLPCMDDDEMRRERPSLHKAFGENIAILASYALIAEGYGGIYRNSRVDLPNAITLCLEATTRCAGIRGATNGQFLDLYPPDSSLETIKKIIYQKTVTLFEISFIFGWLFGGGNSAQLERVRLCAYHLGMAFQIADDLQDAQQAVPINIAIACGRKKAMDLFEEEMAAFTASLGELGLLNESFQEVIDWFWRYVPPEPEWVKN